MDVGMKVRSGSGTELIVVKAPVDGVVSFEPGGVALLGKRYTCATCAAQVLVTTGGDDEPRCHDAAMVVAPTKDLPSSD